MPSIAPTYLETLSSYRYSITKSIANGQTKPLIYPYHFYGLTLFFLYLFVSHKNRPWLYNLRWVVWGVIVWFEVGNLRAGITSTNMAHAFAAGLVSMWDVVWATTMLIFNRPQEDFSRVEVRKNVERHRDGDGEALVTSAREQNGSLKARTNANMNEDGHDKTRPASQQSEYYWQSYPENLWERFDWLQDLLLNFRGPGWSWAIPTLPALPPDVKNKLGEEVTEDNKKDKSFVGVKRFATRKEILRDRLPKFVIGYFLLDLSKTVMMKDPYFYLGPNDYALPPHLQGLSPVFLSLYRQLLTFAAIIVSLEMVFMMAPLVFCCILGPKVLGLRGEPFHYPTSWSTTLDPIFDKGLNGLWGGWWHQTFRFAFASPPNYFISKGWMSSKSVPAKLVALVTAFGISGILHTGGSLTQPVPTKPWNPPIFFMLQAPGILLQTTFCSVFRSYIEKLPLATRRAANLSFAFTWLFITAPLLIDDFARGGIWLYEPIPVSPLRGLGFGVEGDGWWCWDLKHIGVGWYSGKHWWESGIAL